MGFGGSNTNAITYSTSPATLQSGIQAALNTLSSIGTGNSLVSIGSVQTLTFSGPATGGTFTLAFGSQTTAAISYTPAASTLQSNIQSALASLSSIGSGNVSVSAVSQPSGIIFSAGELVFTIAFQGSLAYQALPTMTANNFLTAAPGNLPELTLIPNSTDVDPNTCNVMLEGTLGAQPQPVMSAAATLSGTNPTMAVTTTTTGFQGWGFPTANVGVDTNTVQTITFAGAVITSGTLTAGSGTVTGGTFALAYGGRTTGPISFSTATATLQSDIQAALNALATLGSGNTVVTASSANAVQTISFGGSVTGGSFTLALGGSTTGPITYSAAAATLQSSIQAALNGLASVGTGNSVVSATGATNVKVTFEGALTAQPVATMTDTPSLLGSSPTMAIAASTTGFIDATVTFQGVFATQGNTPAQAIATMTDTENLQGTNPTLAVATTTTGYAGLGQIGIVESSGIPNTNTIGGSLVLLTFLVNPTAPVGTSTINLVASNDPLGSVTVTTGLDSLTRPIPIQPALPIAGSVTVVAQQFSVTAPSAATAGSNIQFTVTALNAGDSTFAGYTGTVHFSSGDSQAVLPPDAVLTNGVGVFTATLKTAGSQTLSASDDNTPGFISSSNAVTVAAATAARLVVTGSPTSVTAGTSVSFTVTAEDTFGNTATGYTGTVHFTSTDTLATLPGDTTLANGTETFKVTLKKAGNQNLTATDTVTTSINGTSSTIAVAPGAATHFAVAIASTVTPGLSFNFTVTALDSFSNTATGYAGTVHFSSSDNQAVLPADATLSNGIGTFSVVLKTSGPRSITTTDTLNTGVMGTATFTVQVAVAVYIPTTLTGFVGGVVTVPIMVNSLNDPKNGNEGLSGAEFVVLYDQSLFSVASSDVSVGTLATNGSTANGEGYSPAEKNGWGVAVEDAPGTIDITLSNTGTGVITDSASGSLVTINFHIKSSAPSTVSMVNLAADDFGGAPMTGLSDRDFSAYVLNPPPIDTVSNLNPYTYVSTPAYPTDGIITITPAPVTVSVPTNLSGGRGSIVTVPIIVSNLLGRSTGNSGLSAATFVVVFNPNVFTVAASDVLLGALPSASTGWNVIANTTTPGLLIIGLQNDGAGNITTTGGGSLVIMNFHIKANAALGLSYINLAADDGGSAPLTGIFDQNYAPYTLVPPPQDDAVLSPAYAVTGSDPDDGIVTITGVNLPPAAVAESYTITARAVASDPALTVAAPGVLANDTDPQSLPLSASLVTGPGHGTVSLNANGSFVYTPAPGFFGSDNFTYQDNDGFSSSPVATVTVTVTARMSIPTNLTAFPGSTVIVPVNMDNPDPTGSGGLAAAVLAIDYDPSVFTVSDSDIQLGSLTSGWNLVPNVNSSTGQIGIFLGNNVPITTTSAGSLALITFHVNLGAPLGLSVIHLVATNSPSGSTVTTYLSALNGTLPLRPAVTNNTNPNVDGLVTLMTPATLVVDSFTPTPTGFVAEFDKPIATAQLNLYNAEFGGLGAPDLTVVSPSGALVQGSLLVDPTATTITFIQTGSGTAGLLAAGTYTVTFRSASNAFTDASGNLLDGLGDGIPGSNFTDVFSVTAPTGPVLSIPDFARGPDGADNILIPNESGTGIPITLTNAVGVTDVTFNLNYNPNLLNISGTLSGTAGTFSLASATGGVASFIFHSSTALTGNLTLGQIVAQVPNGAANDYKAKELLHFSSIVVNSGAITAVGKDGIHVNAYLGDVAGIGTPSPLDASLISRVSVLLDSGFAAFPLLDPSIIGDVSGSGSLSGADTTLMNRLLAGISTPQIPAIPTGLSIVATGPDPSLSLPADLQATPGGSIVVPVYIDTAHPSGSTGATEAILALTYNPRVFDVSAADVQLGSLTASWQLTAVVNAQTGEIGIDIFSSSPIQTTAGGSLVTIGVHVLDTAPAGQTALTLVNQVNPAGQRLFRTEVADTNGALVLELNSAQVSVGGGTLAANHSPAAADNNAADTQFTAQSPLPTGPNLDPLTAVSARLAELVFSELAMPGIVAQEAAVGQPAALLDTDEGDAATAETLGLTAPVQTNGVTQTDWIVDAHPANMRESVKLAVWTSGLGWLDGHDIDEIDS